MKTERYMPKLGNVIVNNACTDNIKHKYNAIYVYTYMYHGQHYQTGIHVETIQQKMKITFPPKGINFGSYQANRV